MVTLQEKESTISDSEWEVMRIIWTLEPVSSTKIIQELQLKRSGQDLPLRRCYAAWLTKIYLLLLKRVDVLFILLKSIRLK